MDYINLLLGIISAIPNQLLQIPRREQMLKLVFNCLEKHTSFSNIWICINYFNKKNIFPESSEKNDQLYDRSITKRSGRRDIQTVPTYNKGINGKAK